MRSPDITRDEYDGARYTPALLAAYDLGVLGINNRFVWRCPTKHLIALYNRNASADHLDIGPGTGWHLVHTTWPTRLPRIALLDLSEDSLAFSARRLRDRGITPDIYVGSVLQSLPTDRQYTSVAANLLMHCVPGHGWGSKGIAFEHIAAATADDGVFFGSTVLTGGVSHTLLSRGVAEAFNRIRVFHNQADDLPGLRQALEAAFEDVSIDTVGSMALWSARRPRREGHGAA
ncbi:Uncharacterised protein [Nocardia africana]|uniref:Methyltransferase domain n=1 Tax=Nocardia africana TaxID=134964 RepID=A0A379X5G1_9NOCA|nr:Uncharacterised protein [Nocardia africana]